MLLNVASLFTARTEKCDELEEFDLADKLPVWEEFLTTLRLKDFISQNNIIVTPEVSENDNGLNLYHIFNKEIDYNLFISSNFKIHAYRSKTLGSRLETFLVSSGSLRGGLNLKQSFREPNVFLCRRLQKSLPPLDY